MMNVQDYLAEWLETTKSKLRPSTHHSYAMAVDRINAHLGRYQLQTLTPLQIERFYTDQLASGGREGRPPAPKTVRNTHVVLRNACGSAVSRTHSGVGHEGARWWIPRPTSSRWAVDVGTGEANASNRARPRVERRVT